MLEIHTYGDPVLRSKAEPVAEVTEEIRQLAKEMLETMYAANGVGLAAEQVGHTESICVIDVPPESDTDEEGKRENPDVQMPLVLINPKITEASEELYSAQEGCLSFPGIYAPVVRSHEVTVEYLNPEGEACSADVCGLVARAVQHELDHLNGVLLADRMSAVKKVTLKSKLKKMVAETRRRTGV